MLNDSEEEEVGLRVSMWECEERGREEKESGKKDERRGKDEREEEKDEGRSER